MLDLETFNAIPAGTLFATGTVTDSPEGCNMTGSGKDLRFVAIKGHANDWAIYVHWASYDIEYVSRAGDKPVCQSNNMACVPCTNEVIKLLRR